MKVNHLIKNQSFKYHSNYQVSNKEYFNSSETGRIACKSKK